MRHYSLLNINIVVIDGKNNAIKKMFLNQKYYFTISVINIKDVNRGAELKLNP